MNIVSKDCEIKNYEIIKEKFDNLDLSPLEDKLSQIIGTKIKLVKEIKRSNNYTTMCIECKEDLKDYVGFLKNSFEKVIIKDFGVYLIQTIEYDDDLVKKLYEEGRYSEIDNIPKTVLYENFRIAIDARYFLKYAGENGISVLRCCYNITENKWTFYER